jgi:glycosyltransferase involved in cell wall biosynthesis
MSAGKPVVATEVGGAAEAVVEGETGFLVASDDDERMAAGIVELLRDPEKAKTFGARGRRIVEEKFSLAAQLEKTLALYDGGRIEAREVAPTN